MWGMIGGAADTPHSVLYLADMVHGAWDNGDFYLVPTPGDGLSFMDLILELKVPSRRWILVSTVKSADPNTRVFDEPRFLLSANGGYFRVRSPEPVSLPFPSSTLLRIHKEPYKLKIHFENRRQPARNDASVESSETARSEGGKRKDGGQEEDDDEDRGSKKPRMRQGGNHHGALITTNHPAANTSSASTDDLFPDCPGVPHLDGTAYLYEEGGRLPDAYPECRNPDCYLQSILRYESEDECEGASDDESEGYSNDDWEVAGPTEAVELCDDLAQVELAAEGEFVGEDDVGMAVDEEVEVAVEGYVEVEGRETQETQMDSAKEGQPKSPPQP